MLFFAGSCYIIFERYSSQVPEDKEDITFEKYMSIVEAQKSPATTEMPETFVKSDIIADQFNNPLNMELIKEQKLMQDKISATDNTMLQSAQNSGVESDNTVPTNDFNNWLRIRLGDLGDFKLNKKLAKDLVPSQFSSTKYIDDSPDKNAKIIQFLERLQDIDEIEANIKADLKDFENKNDFTHDANRLASNSQENHGSDASNKLKSLKLYVTTISNPENSMDRRISANLTNNLENWKQKLSDLFSEFFEDVTPNDHSKKISFNDEINKQANTELEQEYIRCLSDESPDVSQKSSPNDFSTSQSISIQENSEQMENNEKITAKNKDKSNINDSNVSMSASSNTHNISTSKSDEPFLFNLLINMRNTESQHSPEIADEKHVSTENIKDSFERQDNVEHSTSNDDKFQWSNAPARFADDLQPGPVDLTKLIDANYPFSSANSETIEDFISGSKCQVQIVIGVFMVKCPAVNFDEEWNLAPVETQISYFPDIDSFDDFFDYVYDDVNNQEQLTSQHKEVSEVTNTVGLQENIPSKKILSISPERIRLDVVGDPKVIEDDAVHKSNEIEIRQAATAVSPFSYEIDSDYADYVDNEKFMSWLETLSSNQQEALKIEEYDVPDFKHLTSSAEISNLTASALEERLASIFNNETKSLIDYIISTKSSSSEDDYMDAIRDSKSPYMWSSPSPDSWHQQYDAAKKVVKDIRHREFPYALWDSSNNRKKRMIVTELQSGIDHYI